MAEQPLPKWHVEGGQVRQETQLAPSGSGLATVWVVPYTVDSGPAAGTTHEIQIAPRDFTTGHVEQAIRESLNSVHGVASLTGGHA